MPTNNISTVLDNSIELAKKYAPDGFIYGYRSEARISLLENDAFPVKFTDARTVLLPEASIGKLKPYQRNNDELGFSDDVRGYQQSKNITRWVPYTLTQDVGARYVIEMMDDEESMGIAVKSTVGEVTRDVMVPEVDAYAFAKIADTIKASGTIAGNYVDGVLLTSANGLGNQVPAPYYTWTRGLTWLKKHEVDRANMICFCSNDYADALRNTQEVVKVLTTDGERKAVSAKFSDGETRGVELNFDINYINGIPLVEVPPERFKTHFERNALTGEWQWAEDAKAIDFIIMDKKAVRPVTKYQNVRILKGDTALAASNMDGICIYARIYYDVFVINKLINGIYVHTGAFDADANIVDTPMHSLFLGFDPKGKVANLLTLPADIYARVYFASTYTAVGAQFDPSGAVEARVGEEALAKFDAGTIYVHVVDQNGYVVLVEGCTFAVSAGVYSVSLSQVAVDSFVATAGQTSFTLSHASIALVGATVNGVANANFAVSGTTATYSGDALSASDKVVITYTF